VTNTPRGQPHFFFFAAAAAAADADISNSRAMAVEVDPVPQVATERDALLPKHDDPETPQDEILDAEELEEPKITGAKIQYILPALGLGVCTILR
jgi:hypothetical protein